MLHRFYKINLCMKSTFFENVFRYEEGEVREYFPLPRVMDGLFSMIEEVFAIKFERVDSESTWHSDVSLYAVRNEDGSLIGHFYFDPYSRIGPHFVFLLVVL